MKHYVAFLRGINVGGNKIIPMADLATIFEEIGLRNAVTVQAAGNVIFDYPKALPAKLSAKIEKAVEERFGFAVSVQVVELAKIRKLVEDKPFAKFAPSKDTHCYITFLDNYKGSLPAGNDDAFKLLAIRDGVLYSVFYKDKGQSTDSMTFLDKTFGKKITTRNWNTLLKIAAVVH